MYDAFQFIVVTMSIGCWMMLKSYFLVVVNFLHVNALWVRCGVKNTHNVSCRRMECICRCLKTSSLDIHIDTIVVNKFVAENKKLDFLPLQIYISVEIQINF